MVGPSWHSAFAVELRAEAMGLALRGWPVLPGNQPSAGENSLPKPLHTEWQDLLNAKTDVVTDQWADGQHSLLVATGTVVDAIEVSAELGRAAAKLLRRTGKPAPIIALPDGKWVFLVSSPDRLPADLSEYPDIRWHGTGSWVPLPPSSYAAGLVHWRVKPDVCGWQLPSADSIYDVIIAAQEGRFVLSEDVRSELLVSAA